jgi:hypothetical protein
MNHFGWVNWYFLVRIGAIGREGGCRTLKIGRIVIQGDFPYFFVIKYI